MALTLAEIRAKLQAQDNKQTQTPVDSAIYPHWNIAEGDTAKIRFLPDGNAKNEFFWVERAMIKLPFVGVKGQMDSKRVEVQVPCVEMYGKEYTCPILTQVRPWFKDPNLEDLGRKYWKKKSYLFQGFVRENPMSDDVTPENPIRRFIISPQIFNLIRSALLDPELENLPIDYQAGLDFIVSKTSKGGYADYSTSKWSRKESSLTSSEQAALDQFGLYNLSEFLPKKPTDVELKVIEEMFEASVDGRPYDLEAWGSYFKPYGLNGDNSKVFGARPPAAEPAKKTNTVVPMRTAVAAATVDVDDEVDEAPFEPAVSVPEAKEPVQTATKPKAGNQRAEDILAMIRNRQQKQ